MSSEDYSMMDILRGGFTLYLEPSFRSPRGATPTTG